MQEGSRRYWSRPLPTRPSPLAFSRVKPASVTEFPLAPAFLLAGLVTGLAAMTFFMAPLAGLCFLILFGCVGLIWSRWDPPIFVFTLAYQWLFIVTGYFYMTVVGEYPALILLGDLSGAVMLSLLGLLALALGMRAAFSVRLRALSTVKKKMQAIDIAYDPKKVFWVVIAAHASSYVVDISPARLFFNAAQIIHRFLEFRTVLLAVLILVVVKQREGYRYGFLGFIFCWLLTFGSGMSTFKETIFLLAIIILSEWRPWSPLPHERRQSKYLILGALGLALIVGVMAVVWEGAIKPIWRPAFRAGEVADDPTERLQQFSETVGDGLSNFALGKSTTDLASRLSSGVGYFSNVLEHVPYVVPHENGSLTWRAIEHTITPRILFPDKGDLGVDSWLVEIYAGLPVAGAELETSVGLTYMAEFYIDFGVFGMMVALFLYGVILAALYRLIALFSPSAYLYWATVVIILLNHFTSYEGEIAKLLGGMIQSFLVFGLILKVVGPFLHRFMAKSPTQMQVAAPFRRGPGRSPRPPGPAVQGSIERPSPMSPVGRRTAFD